MLLCSRQISKYQHISNGWKASIYWLYLQNTQSKWQTKWKGGKEIIFHCWKISISWKFYWIPFYIVSSKNENRMKGEWRRQQTAHWQRCWFSDDYVWTWLKHTFTSIQLIRKMQSESMAISIKQYFTQIQYLAIWQCSGLLNIALKKMYELFV